ncbi:uncharacterized protein [Solanum lycopersicum]|uniref:uncharacterized protein n=1 Tax=Solanum lycopersicum TaxID=4081 RepID=UPI0037482166
MAELTVATLGHNHPLHLQPSDMPGVALITTKLTGPENYGLWSRSMRLALLVKNKIGFIDGTCLKSMFKDELAVQWERCNAVVLSWICSTVANNLLTTIVYASNAKRVWEDFKERFDKSNLTRIYQLWTEVATLKQGTDSVTEYYSKLRDLWDEYDVLVPSPSCKCDDAKPYIEHLHQQRLMMFLMGLNETFSHVRSDLLLKSEVPTINQAYATVIQEESQRVLGVMDSNKEPLTMMAGRGQGQGFKGKKVSPGNNNIGCEICGFKNHVTEKCYRLVGYPSDFKSKRKQSDSSGSYQNNNEGSRSHGSYSNNTYNNTGNFKPYANNASIDKQREESEFTKKEYNQMKSLLHNKEPSDCKANLTGTLQWQGDWDW